MPPDDGLWFYNDENGPPVTPDPGLLWPMLPNPQRSALGHFLAEVLEYCSGGRSARISA